MELEFEAGFENFKRCVSLSLADLLFENGVNYTCARNVAKLLVDRAVSLIGVYLNELKLEDMGVSMSNLAYAGKVILEMLRPCGGFIDCYAKEILKMAKGILGFTLDDLEPFDECKSEIDKLVKFM